MTETKLNIPADCEVVIGLQSSRKNTYYFGRSMPPLLKLFGGEPTNGIYDDFVKNLASRLAREITSNNKVFGFYFCNGSGPNAITWFEPFSVLSSQEWDTSCLLAPWQPGRWHRLRDTLEATVGPHRSKRLRLLVLVIYDSIDTDLFIDYLRQMIQTGDEESPWRTLVTIVAPNPYHISASSLEGYFSYDDLASSLLVIPETVDDPSVDDVIRAIQSKLAKIDYSNADTSALKLVKTLEAENAKLKQMYANLALENDTLKEHLKEMPVFKPNDTQQ